VYVCVSAAAELVLALKKKAGANWVSAYNKNVSKLSASLVPGNQVSVLLGSVDTVQRKSKSELAVKRAPAIILDVVKHANIFPLSFTLGMFGGVLNKVDAKTCHRIPDSLCPSLRETYGAVLRAKDPVRIASFVEITPQQAADAYVAHLRKQPKPQQQSLQLQLEPESESEHEERDEEEDEESEETFVPEPTQLVRGLKNPQKWMCFIIAALTTLFFVPNVKKYVEALRKQPCPSLPTDQAAAQKERADSGSPFNQYHQLQTLHSIFLWIEGDKAIDLSTTARTSDQLLSQFCTQLGVELKRQGHADEIITLVLQLLVDHATRAIASTTCPPDAKAIATQVIQDYQWVEHRILVNDEEKREKDDENSSTIPVPWAPSVLEMIKALVLGTSCFIQ